MKSKLSTLVAGVLIGLLFSGILFLMISKPRGDPIQLKPFPTQPPLRIHIAGEVVAPGVIMLPIGSIAGDALQVAGGPTVDADLDHVNLAAVLTDGDQLIIPALLPTPDATQTMQFNSEIRSEPSGEQININTAGIRELEALPGIGPSLAGKIIEYRDSNGQFTSLEQITRVSGIGPSKFDQIKDKICLH
jgi:competence protein ComEA